MIRSSSNLASCRHASMRGRVGRALRATLVAAMMALPLSAGSSASAQYRLQDPPATGPAVQVASPEVMDRTGSMLPLDLEFTTSDGKKVKLDDLYKQGKPVVLSLVYFKCQSLCIYTQDDLARVIRTNPRGIELGKDYDVVVVSIDPDDLPGEAAAKKIRYLEMMGRGTNSKGLTYLVGSEKNVKTLADAVGFGYKRNYGVEETDSVGKFAHSAGIFVTTSYGKISQTIQGVGYSPDAFHNAVIVAAQGKIGTGMLGVGLACGAVHFNPSTGRYEHNQWFWAGAAVGMASLAFVSLFLGNLWLGEYKKHRKKTELPGGPTPALP